MTGENETPASQGWYVARWSPLAWLETLIKSIAILIGIAALANALSNAALEWPSGLRVAQFVVLAILCLGLVAAIFDRFSRREVVSMGFVLFNNLGHWAMLIALAFVPRPTTSLVYFSVLMLGGDLVKLASFKVDNFTQSGVSTATLYGLTSFYILGYAILLALEWLA